MPPEKVNRAAPCEFCSLPIVCSGALFIQESMVSVVTKNFESFAARLQFGLEGIDHRWSDPLIPQGEVSL
jgi:hypothetical protein